MICPNCKKAFTPRTAKQSVCGLKCFAMMKRREGIGKRTAAAEHATAGHAAAELLAQKREPEECLEQVH